MQKSTAMMIFVIAAALVFTAPVFAQNAVIREVSGTVELKRPGSTAWVPARAGDQIERSAIISTGLRSRAILAVGSSTITVQPVTRLTLAELITRNQTETVNLNLSAGRVRVDVNPQAGVRTEFSVQTPSVTASVRGTSFEMGTDNIRVSQGAVRYTASAGTGLLSVTVNAGERSWVDAVTGAVVFTMAAAEIEGSLPPLPGQQALTERSARLEGMSLVIDITLIEE